MNRSQLEFIAGLSLLWLGLLFSYACVWEYPLLDYDDPAYLTQHPLAEESLGASHFWKELLTSSTVNLWHPFTVLSHQLGLRLTSHWGWHHLINLLGHGCLATLWAMTIRSLTGKHLTAIASALFFAWHPVTVESVAWLSGRKDILCTLFLVGMILSHIQWTRQKTPWIYTLSILMGCGAMLSKPVAFVAPLLLLVLDLALLKRPWLKEHIFREKLLWLIPSILTISLTLKFQTEGNQAILDPRSLFEKAAGALWALQHAFGSMLYPTKLHLAYRDPQSLQLSHLLLVALCAFTVFFLAIRWRRKQPYLLAGLIFIGLTLGPTLGLIRAGNHLAADRYCYLPLLGLSLILAGFLKKLPTKASLMVACLAVPLLFAQKKQSAHWQSLESLFRHTLALDPENPTAHAQIAQIHENHGDRELARKHLEKAIHSQPGSAGAHLLLANIALSEMRWEEAQKHYLIASKVRSQDPAIYHALAECSSQLNQDEQAEHYREKARLLETTGK